jgi:hypothetical protein
MGIKMKMIGIISFLLIIPSLCAAQNYRIDWYVIGSGGGHAESGNYQVNGTIGQPIVGQSSSSNYIVEAGYWVGIGGGISLGYEYFPGDANMYNGIWPPQVIGGDVTYLVNYFRGLPAGRPCLLNGFWCSADANGDCNIIGSDVTKLVNYFRGIGSILHCADYEPAWLTPGDLPPVAPDGWPNCETPAVVSDIQVLPSSQK